MIETVGGSLTVNGISISPGTNSTFDSNTLFIDGANHRVGILTTTPNAPLQVNGAANVQGVAYFANTFSVIGAASFSNTITMSSAVGFSGNVAFDTNVLFVDGTNNRVGVGTVTPDAKLAVNGTANVATTNQFFRVNSFSIVTSIDLLIS